MGNLQTQLFRCPTCGREFDWSERIAGHKTRCACGQTFAAPTTPEHEEDIYDLAPQAATPVQPIHSAAKPPSAVPLAYASPKKKGDTKADPQTIVNLYAPIWILGGGIVVLTLSEIFEQKLALPAALMRVGIQTILGTGLMLVGIFIASRFRGFKIGPLQLAALKLGAISVGPAAAVSLVGPLLAFIPLGGIIGLVGCFILYFALIGLFFDLDESDTWLCVVTIFLINVGVFILLRLA